jgi:dCTP diphosphatase
VSEPGQRGWSDGETTLRTVQEALRTFNVERDWGQFHSPRNLAMSVSVEASELLELFLWSADAGPQPAVASREPRVAEEAADVLLTLLNLCDRAGIDLLAAADAKLAKNAERYPVALARGRLEKASELE